MIAIREGFNQTLATALTEVSASSGQAAGADDSEVVALRAENKKLEYRVTTLLRTIDEIEGEKK